MERYEVVRAEVVALIRELGVQVGQSLNMCDIGVPLVAKGYTQDELTSAIFWLEHERLPNWSKARTGLGFSNHSDLEARSNLK